MSTPTVRSPSGSASAANLKASAVAKSALQAQTTNMLCEGSMKVFDKRLVSSGTSVFALLLRLSLNQVDPQC